ncbi:MAG TPA: PEP-CTERM sorting domain-containing protein [Pirellulales bacterium]|nr:PEP-CTERM sorting domain-containing protein [Pirellulales bacterium]
MSTSIQTLVVRALSRRALVSCLAIAATSAVLCAATPAVAQPLDDVTVPINTVVAPGQPIDLFFTELLDFDHHKDLLFQGVAHGPLGAVGILDVQFDWLDPAGGIALSPIFPVDVMGDTPFLIPFQIDFCPERISLHLVNEGPVPGFPIEVNGTFNYRCVPEPSSLVLVACGFIGLAAYGWRKKR